MNPSVTHFQSGAGEVADDRASAGPEVTSDAASIVDAAAIRSPGEIETSSERYGGALSRDPISRDPPRACLRARRRDGSAEPHAVLPGAQHAGRGTGLRPEVHAGATIEGAAPALALRIPSPGTAHHGREKSADVAVSQPFRDCRESRSARSAQAAKSSVSVRTWTDARRRRARTF